MRVSQNNMNYCIRVGNSVKDLKAVTLWKNAIVKHSYGNRDKKANPPQ